MSQPHASKAKLCADPFCGSYFDYDYRSGLHGQAVANGWTVWQTEQAFLSYWCPKHTIQEIAARRPLLFRIVRGI